jgi:hypothetical protein
MKARAASMLICHIYHPILFGFATPINRVQPPSEKRIKRLRVETSNGRWWLTRTYGLLFSFDGSVLIL